MAAVKISNKFSTKLSGISQKDINKISIKNIQSNQKITDKTYSVKNIEYKPIRTSLTDQIPKVLLSEILPFRIKITNIGIDSYGPNNPAPIGIALIGLNNYIL